MDFIFLVNLAVSIVMALGLWLTWRYNPDQRFARSIAMVTLANGLFGIAYSLWVGLASPWHQIAQLAMALLLGAMFAFLWLGVADLQERRLHRHFGPLSAAAVFALYAFLLFSARYELAGGINTALWMLTGTVCTAVLWRFGWLERTVGLLITAVGLNSLWIAYLGPDGMRPMFAVGVVLRVAIGIAFISAAMVRTHAATLQAKARYKVLSQNAPLGMAVVSDGKLVYANPAAARIGGYSDTQAAIQDDFLSLVGSGQRLAAQHVLQQIESGQRQFMDVRCQCVSKSGQDLYLQVSAWPIQWDQGLAVQMVFSDETRKHLAEKEVADLQQRYAQQQAEFAERSKKALLQANAELEVRVVQRTQELEEASQAKSRFLASMSHEIRTPLNVVLGLLELLQKTEQTVAQADYAKKAKQAARSLLGLLNDLLDFSKVDAGRLELDAMPFAMAPLMRDLSALVAVMVDNKPLAVHFDVDPRLPPALVGDAQRLQQVLLNLLSNAVKFTAQGEVRLQVQLQDLADNQATLRFAVSDTGIGIAPQQQESIFEVFTQLDASVTRRYGGSGLGLAICRRLLALMGAELQLQSEPGRGSTFQFELSLPLATDAQVPQDPVAAERLVDEPDSEQAAALQRIAPALRGGLHGLRVLVVEDNPMNRLVATELLCAEGAWVQTAENGAVALAKLGQAPRDFHVVLMDMQMPVVDGCTATRLLRRVPALMDLPVIAMTANSAQSDKDACLAAGMNGHIGKPFDIATLVQRLRPYCTPDAQEQRIHISDAPDARMLEHVREAAQDTALRMAA